MPLHVLNQLPRGAVRVAGARAARREDRGAGSLAAEEPARAFRAGAGSVAKVLPLLERGRGSLHAQLADALLRTGGVQVPRDAFREDLLPPHLRMNFLLIDDADKVIARSRSLAALRDRHAGASQQTLRETVAAHYRRAHLGVRRSSRTPGDAAAGAGRWGIPRWSDEGDTVGLRVFATPPRRA